jgi:hypothetical protein
MPPMSPSPQPPGSPRAGIRSACWIISICFVLGTLAVGIAVLKNDGFPLDDSWIHQVIGRNAARFGVPGFIPGIATAGSTSAIWPWIIAANYRIFPGVSASSYLLAVNILCLATIIVVLLFAALRDQLRPVQIILLAALPAITGNFVWLISSGMEHLLFIATAFLAAHFWYAKGPQTWPSVLAGVCCGLSISTRPEAVVFIPLFLLAGWRIGKSRRDFLCFALPCGLFCALVAFNNTWTSHSLMPATLDGRRWLYFTHPTGAAAAKLMGFLSSWADHMDVFFFGVSGSLRTQLRLAAALLAVALLGIYRLARNHSHCTLFLLLLAGANFAIYAALLPAGGQAMRYQAMLLIFVFPLVALGVLQFIEQVTRWMPGSSRQRWVIDALAAVPVFAVALASLSGWSRITDVGIQHINGTHVRMGKWLAANLPHGTPVASLDIGAVGYFGAVRVIDLGGLTDPAFVPYLYSGNVAAYLRTRAIQFVVLPEQGDVSCAAFTQRLRLCDGIELTKQRVVSFSTPYEIWNPGVEATSHALQRQALYKITWK